MDEKPVYWMGTSKKDLLRFPAEVVNQVGFALGAVQNGGHPPSARVWKGLGPGIFEIVAQDERGTYRAVYTLQLVRAIYVLHVFQKKSPSGIKTARRDIALVAQRLADACADYEVRYGKNQE